MIVIISVPTREEHDWRLPLTSGQWRKTAKSMSTAFSEHDFIKAAAEQYSPSLRRDGRWQIFHLVLIQGKVVS